MRGVEGVCARRGRRVGADTAFSCPQYGQTPLQLAVKSGEASAAQLLRQLGATQ